MSLRILPTHRPDRSQHPLILRLSSLEAAVNRLPFGESAAVEQIIKNILYLGLVDRIGFLLKDEEKGEEL